MIDVYKALLNEAKSGKLTYSDLFKATVNVQKSMSRTGYTVASVAQARRLAHSEIQAVKNSSSSPIVLQFPNGDTKSYATKLEAVTDMQANLSTYYAEI